MKAVERSGTFTLATYNIQITNHPEEILANLKQMKASGVSLFCLQEIREVDGEKFIGDRIKEVLGKHWESVYFVLSDSLLNSSHGLGVFWDTRIFTLEKATELFLPLANRIGPVERAVAKITGFKTKPSQRKALVCNFTAFGKKIRVTNVHLDWQQGPKQRIAQLQYLMDYLRSEKKVAYECLCGDFNTIHPMKENKEQFRIADFFGHEYRDITGDIPWTIDWQNTDFTPPFHVLGSVMKKFNIHCYLKLDYIWVKNLTAQDVQALPLPGSDHLPIVATLKI